VFLALNLHLFLSLYVRVEKVDELHICLSFEKKKK
jgi:hypothetical protein